MWYEFVTWCHKGFCRIKDYEDNSPAVTADPRDKITIFGKTENFAPGSLLTSFFSLIFLSHSAVPDSLLTPSTYVDFSLSCSLALTFQNTILFYTLNLFQLQLLPKLHIILRYFQTLYLRVYEVLLTSYPTLSERPFLTLPYIPGGFILLPA
jgi:hypothetical protein